MDQIQAVGRLSERSGETDSVLDELARRVATGDRHAYDQIYRLTAPEILNYLVGATRNETIAEDLAADVYLKAWRSARSYKPGSNNYRRWLFAIARNETRDYWRELKPATSIDGVDLAEPNDQLVPDDSVYIRERLAGALLLLTPEQREVLILRFYDGKSYQEIAGLLSKREGAVRALVMRALRQMRKVMDDASPTQ